MRDFKGLEVWKKSHLLTLAVYKATSSFPQSELFGLTSQIRRASASIPANIAEGCGRSGQKELVHFFNIALGSASELEYHLLLAHDLSLLGDPTYDDLTSYVVEVKRMLGGFIRTLKADPT